MEEESFGKEEFLEKKIKIEVIPGGEYTCVQVEVEPEMDLEKIIYENWAKKEKMTIIIDNMMAEKCNFKTSISELQRLGKFLPS